jgi:hypothetical protein
MPHNTRRLPRNAAGHFIGADAVPPPDLSRWPEAFVRLRAKLPRALDAVKELIYSGVRRDAEEQRARLLELQEQMEFSSEDLRAYLPLIRKARRDAGIAFPMEMPFRVADFHSACELAVALVIETIKILLSPDVRHSPMTHAWKGTPRVLDEEEVVRHRDGVVKAHRESFDCLRRQVEDEIGRTVRLQLRSGSEHYGAPEISTIWYHGERSYSTDGRNPVQVSMEKHNALQAFLDGERALDTRALENSGVSNASTVMKKLVVKFGEGCVRRPKSKGEGYYIRVRTRHG